MNRRGFLGSILALGAAPAIVRADSLMRIIPMDAPLILPTGATFANPTFTGRIVFNTDDVQREVLRIMHEKMKFVRNINELHLIHGDVLST